MNNNPVLTETRKKEYAFGEMCNGHIFFFLSFFIFEDNQP